MPEASRPPPEGQIPETAIGFQQFESLLHTVLMRLHERFSADAALFRLLHCNAIARLFLASGKVTEDQMLRELLDAHGRIKESGATQLDAEYSRDTIIVAITLFDSFLTDLTRFLFLLRPQALPKDRQVRMHDVLVVGSYDELVTGIVDRFVLELAYKSARDRLQVLAGKFGFDLTPLNAPLTDLEHCVTLRNALVHTTSRFRYSATSLSGVGVAVESTIPTSITPEMAERSILTVRTVIAVLAESIGLKIFDRKPELAAWIGKKESQT